MTYAVPAESREFIGGVTVTSDSELIAVFELALVPHRQRPAETDWKAPYVRADGKKGLLVGPGTSLVLPSGLYKLWVRYEDAAERPVLDDVAVIHIT